MTKSSPEGRSTLADGMRIDWDVPIVMSDGIVLRADIFRPDDDSPHPVIMTHGPYAKGLPFQEGYAGMWNTLVAAHPEVLEGSTNAYQNWETVDPEKWVPDGYVCVRVDSRGSGRSPGYLDILSPQETRDYYECIEWAGVQAWSNGKVGLLGISYYAMNQWQVAALQPPHLAAICPWEGGADYYREFVRHAGILNIFVSRWYPIQVASIQHGVGNRGPRNPHTGDPVAGPETLSDHDLSANRADVIKEIYSRPFDDSYYRDRSPDLSKIRVPLLSAANWAHHLHTRGNFEGYLAVSSREKWLEAHGLEHFTEFYTDYGIDLQKRFFGHFLAGRDTRWGEQPAVQLNARLPDGTFERRSHAAWPPPEVEWTKMDIDLSERVLSRNGMGGSQAPLSRLSFAASGSGLTFTTPVAEEPFEVCGPASARLFLESSTEDADIFVVIRLLDPAGNDVRFVSGLDPRGVPAAGWLRASHRALDAERSLPHRPWHPHQRAESLQPGEVVQLDIEIWPTSIVVPAGYRLAVTITGRDFEYPADGPVPEVYGVPMQGHGMFIHNDPNDRPAETFDGALTVWSDKDHPSWVLLPIIARTS